MKKGPALQSLGLKSRVVRATSLAINPTRAAEKRAVFALQSQHPTCWAVGSARLENHHNCNRQSCSTIPRDPVADVMGPGLARAGDQGFVENDVGPVSYTHLTLPTKA